MYFSHRPSIYYAFIIFDFFKESICFTLIIVNKVLRKINKESGVYANEEMMSSLFFDIKNPVKYSPYRVHSFIINIF